MLSIRAKCVLMVFGIFSGAYAHAQDVSDPTPLFHSRSNIVLVPTLVKTGSGEPVFGLNVNDFILTEDGIEQKISLEENFDSQPLALVIVVQTGGAGRRRLDTYQELGPLLDSVVGAVPHCVAVVGFDSEPHIEAEFTPDLNNVAEVMANLPPGDGGAAIVDSLHFAVELLRKQPVSYRRAILSISETLDHGSQGRFEDAVHAIAATNTTIYSLGFSTTKADMKHDADEFNSDTTPAPTHGCLAKDQSNGSESHPVQVPDGKGNSRTMQTFDCATLLAPPLFVGKMLVMAVLDGMHRNVPKSVAQLAGGEYFRFENRRELARGLITISNLIPNNYVLSFSPQADSTGFHLIDVRLKDRTGLHIDARKGYWVDTAP
ncbi:MAG TPA: VWA domain-containing protein [Silvibacterium sp.]|nr:VWA domain-containing protein [Silvibacterium sp.]